MCLNSHNKSHNVGCDLTHLVPMSTFVAVLLKFWIKKKEGIMERISYEMSRLWVCRRYEPISKVLGYDVLRIFFERLRPFLLTSDTTDILCIIYSNFCIKLMPFKVSKSTFKIFW